MKIFIQDTPIKIAPIDKKINLENYQEVIPFQKEKKIDLKKLSGKIIIKNATTDILVNTIKELRTTSYKKIKKITFTIKDYKEAVEQVKKLFKIVKAAGGIVTKGEKVLLINRLRKWDLPKGKLEKNEAVTQGALREVEEECNVKVRLGKKIGSTWHAYTSAGGKPMLKKTTWFAMKCVDDSEMSPQRKENIEAVKWMSKKAAKKAVAASYGSIRCVLDKYFSE